MPGQSVKNGQIVSPQFASEQCLALLNQRGIAQKEEPVAQLGHPVVPPVNSVQAILPGKQLPVPGHPAEQGPKGQTALSRSTSACSRDGKPLSGPW